MKTNIINISPPIPLSGKILVLQLWAKMLSASQIAGLFLNVISQERIE